MRPMARVERFFERLVERPTARVFGTRVQPIQVLRRIEREMEASRRRGHERTLAPDRFRVRLSPDGLTALGPPDSVAQQLASGALAFARAHGLTLLERPSVELEGDASLARGDVEVTARFSAQRPPGIATDDDPGAGTRVFEAPVVRAPAAALEIVEAGRAPRHVSLGARPTTIGRGSDCEIVLADAHASRHHVRLEVRGGVIVLTDLGSTNGTRVNGHRVREVVLGVGDRIELGQSTLRVVQPETPATGA
jgi:FHA domain-containing protein